MKKLLFHTSEYAYLAERLREFGKFKEGEVEVTTFPDGERYQRILTPIEGRRVVLVGGTCTDQSTLELFDLASALVALGADSLELVVPYFGYSTMERAVKPGEVVTAKSRARLLSALPRSNKGNRIYLFDLHAEGLPYYFEEPLHAIHIYCKDLIMEAAKRHGGANFVLGSTDAGRAKWVTSLARDMGAGAALILKRRISGTETEIASINADVDGKTVVIYDDMIRSGGSIIRAAEAYKEAGAQRMVIITTHGVFIGNSLDRLADTGLFDKIVCTDTHSRVMDLDHPLLEVISIAELITKSLN